MLWVSASFKSQTRISILIRDILVISLAGRCTFKALSKENLMKGLFTERYGQNERTSKRWRSTKDYQQRGSIRKGSWVLGLQDLRVLNSHARESFNRNCDYWIQERASVRLSLQGVWREHPISLPPPTSWTPADDAQRFGKFNPRN